MAHFEWTGWLVPAFSPVRKLIIPRVPVQIVFFLLAQGL